MTEPTSGRVQATVQQVLNDPGRWVPRRKDAYGHETLADWQARALDAAGLWGPTTPARLPWVRVYVNVNEEGEDYDSHDTLEAALAVQDEFPNDTIEVRVTGPARTPSGRED